MLLSWSRGAKHRMPSGSAIQKSGAKYSRYLAIGQHLDAFWHGRTAEKLGIAGAVSDERTFQALTDLKDPTTGEQLKPKHKQKITMWDLTIGTQKSVSIMALYDPGIYRLHREAAASIPSIEEGMVPSQNMVWTQVHHLESRAGDAHIHTHTPILNLTWNDGAGKWECLRHNFMNYWAQYQLRESYRTQMAQSLINRGYEITDKPKQGFEIAGVQPETIERFSQRANHIRQIDSWGYRDRAAYDRPAKQLYAATYDIYLEQQKEKLTQAERISLKETVEIAQEKAYRLNLRWDVGEAEEYGPSIRPLRTYLGYRM